jgi:hypothetical protein
MKVGDLVKTTNGNLALITHVDSLWCDILYCDTGHHRSGFPKIWLRSLK